MVLATSLRQWRMQPRRRCRRVAGGGGVSRAVAGPRLRGSGDEEERGSLRRLCTAQTSAIAAVSAMGGIAAGRPAGGQVCGSRQQLL